MKTTDNTIFHRYGTIITNKIMDTCRSQRSYLFGIAITAVVLYHAHCMFSSRILSVFSFGYAGVDIFMFLSGLGLCRSFNTNSLSTFYSRRFFRIIPAFIAFALAKTIIVTSVEGSTLTAWDWICNLTSLSYYHVGGIFIDWYLSALLLFYLLFPLIYKKTSIYTIAVVTILIIVSFRIFGQPYWTFDCAISRLPAFMAGIYAYKASDRTSILFMTLTAFLPVVAVLESSRFLLSTAMVPILLLLCVLIMPVIKSIGLLKPMNRIGTYSLEIYIGNCLAMCMPYAKSGSPIVMGGVIC